MSEAATGAAGTLSAALGWGGTYSLVPKGPRTRDSWDKDMLHYLHGASPGSRGGRLPLHQGPSRKLRGRLLRAVGTRLEPDGVLRAWLEGGRGKEAKMHFRRPMAESPGEVSTWATDAQVTCHVRGQLRTTGRKRAHVPECGRPPAPSEPMLIRALEEMREEPCKRQT